MIYHIHRYNVIEPYIVKPKHEIKLIEKNIVKEHKKNNFFIELSDLSKQQKNGIVEMTNIIGNKVYNKAANDLASIAMLQFKELIDSPFYRRYLCKYL